jgi:osmoprotectant transport system permease protein
MFAYIFHNGATLLQQTGQHLWLVSMSIFMAALFGVPAAYWLSFHEQAANVVLYVASMIFTLPSVVLFGLLMPILAPYGHGIGWLPAFIALVIYAQLPIFRNAYAAFRGQDVALLDAARGIGMTRFQRFAWVEFPNAMPIIMAGVRNAVTMNIAVATIAAYIGAGGLGEPIAQGIESTNMAMASAGALLVALLSIVMDLLLSNLQVRLTPRGALL